MLPVGASVALPAAARLVQHLVPPGGQRRGTSRLLCWRLLLPDLLLGLDLVLLIALPLDLAATLLVGTSVLLGERLDRAQIKAWFSSEKQRQKKAGARAALAAALPDGDGEGEGGDGAGTGGGAGKQKPPSVARMRAEMVTLGYAAEAKAAKMQGRANPGGG